MVKFIWMPFLVVTGALAAAPAHADCGATCNLLVNGSFETGNFSGWTQSGNFEFTSVEASGSGPFNAEDGRYYVLAGPVGSMGYLGQSFNDAAGQSYTLSGWVLGSGWQPSEVVFYWDGAPVITEDPVQTDGEWTQFTTTVVASGHDTFMVGFRNDPAFDGLDNFSAAPVGQDSSDGSVLTLADYGDGDGFQLSTDTLTIPGGIQYLAVTVPETPAWFMMLAGFGALGALGLRHRQRASKAIG